MKITLRQWQYAIAAARHGSLTTAANALHVSQPSISMAITQIEGHFERPLFVRQRGSGVGLTSFGQIVIAQAKEIVAKAETLEALSEDGAVPSGELVLGCFEDLAPYCVPPIVARLRRKCPAVQVLVHEQGFDTIGRHLHGGMIDLAITYDLGLPADVVCTVLCELAPHALLPADHPLAERATLTLAELADEPLILTDQAQSWQHVLELFQMRGIKPAHAIRTGSFELQRSMVANHLGVAVVYSRPFSDFSYDGQPLIRKPIADPLPIQRILLVHNRNRVLSAAHLAFIEETKAWFDDTWPAAVAGQS